MIQCSEEISWRKFWFRVHHLVVLHFSRHISPCRVRTEHTGVESYGIYVASWSRRIMWRSKWRALAKRRARQRSRRGWAANWWSMLWMWYTRTWIRANDAWRVEIHRSIVLVDVAHDPLHLRLNHGWMDLVLALETEWIDWEERFPSRRRWCKILGYRRSERKTARPGRN